jgi:hypothetical protein
MGTSSGVYSHLSPARIPRSRGDGQRASCPTPKTSQAIVTPNAYIQSAQTSSPSHASGYFRCLKPTGAASQTEWRVLAPKSPKGRGKQQGTSLRPASRMCGFLGSGGSPDTRCRRITRPPAGSAVGAFGDWWSAGPARWQPGGRSPV